MSNSVQRNNLYNDSENRKNGKQNFKQCDNSNSTGKNKRNDNSPLQTTANSEETQSTSNSCGNSVSNFVSSNYQRDIPLDTTITSTVVANSVPSTTETEPLLIVELLQSGGFTLSEAICERHCTDSAKHNYPSLPPDDFNKPPPPPEKQDDEHDEHPNSRSTEKEFSSNDNGDGPNSKPQSPILEDTTKNVDIYINEIPCLLLTENSNEVHPSSTSRLKPYSCNSMGDGPTFGSNVSYLEKLMKAPSNIATSLDTPSNIAPSLDTTQLPVNVRTSPMTFKDLSSIKQLAFGNEWCTIILPIQSILQLRNKLATTNFNLETYSSVKRN